MFYGLWLRFFLFIWCSFGELEKLGMKVPPSNEMFMLTLSDMAQTLEYFPECVNQFFKNIV
jgi:hypothetical protein